jgi:hypothetical protein
MPIVLKASNQPHRFLDFFAISNVVLMVHRRLDSPWTSRSVHCSTFLRDGKLADVKGRSSAYTFVSVGRRESRDDKAGS